MGGKIDYTIKTMFIPYFMATILSYYIFYLSQREKNRSTYYLSFYEQGREMSDKTRNEWQNRVRYKDNVSPYFMATIYCLILFT